MEIETSPPQPDEVVRAIAQVLDDAADEPDPWWRAGVEDALAE